MAYDITSTNLLLKGTKLAIVLDRDIKNDVPKFIKNHKECSGLKIDFLPIKSLEKYLRDKLFINVDAAFFSELDSYIFLKIPLAELLSKYKCENKKDDSDGKILYGYLLNELRSMRKDREDLAEVVIRYIMIHEESSVNELTKYLKGKIQD